MLLKSNTILVIKGRILRRTETGRSQLENVIYTVQIIQNYKVSLRKLHLLLKVLAVSYLLVFVICLITMNVLGIFYIQYKPLYFIQQYTVQKVYSSKEYLLIKSAKK